MSDVDQNAPGSNVLAERLRESIIDMMEILRLLSLGLKKGINNEQLDELESTADRLKNFVKSGRTFLEARKNTGNVNAA
ncbi:hypothetical protein PLICBS_010283 [Purpureocillium lilacinum]|uniref:uncharacterized protein n=1 Tax=Purpureocillium lilacinum TaxID=33203 RepID=UPI002080F4CB|nr:hypothetical protein PLICBS_010283 [Purpureocillium lilacinum]